MRNTKTKYLIQLALFLAITIVVAATPLGYLPLGPLSFTILVLPVAIGGLTLGMPAGILLGLAFGITSFMKAPAEALGIVLLEHNLLLTIIICIVPRLLVGIAAGGLGIFLKKRSLQTSFWGNTLVGFICSCVNTIFFVGMIELLCGTVVQNAFGSTLVALTYMGGIIEAFGNAFLTGSIMLAVNKFLNKAQ